MDPCRENDPGELAHLPFGYSVVSFVERFTNAGPEATVVYMGPSTDRFGFLQEVFGTWAVAINPIDGACCACLVNPPVPYPYLLKVEDDDSCVSGRDCLYPDTFSIAAEGRNAIPTVFECTNDSPPLPGLELPLFYGNGANLPTCQCPAQITVNYRYKTHAGWPRYFEPCTNSGLWTLPNVPDGTFIEVRTNSALSVKTIPSTSMRYKTDVKYGKPGLLCDLDAIPLAAELDTPPAFCSEDTGVTDGAVPSQLAPGKIRNSETLEIKWSNVPLADWDHISSMKGRVNRRIFLGYAPESVLFETVEPTIRGIWGHDGEYCGEVYDLVFRFTVLSAPVELEPVSVNLTEEELLAWGVYNSRVGLWNRLWSVTPMRYEADVGAGMETMFCTNWVPVVLPAREPGCCDTAERSLYEREHDLGCFDRLFSIPTCLQCLDECTPWPDCAFDPPP